MTEFGEFTVEVAAKPVSGVSEVEIPVKLVEYLAEHAKDVIGSEDKELILTAANETDAKKLALYSRAWGARQDPKLFIHKVPNKKGMSPNVARLAVKLDAEVLPENRPGRKK